MIAEFDFCGEKKSIARSVWRPCPERLAEPAIEMARHAIKERGLLGSFAASDLQTWELCLMNSCGYGLFPRGRGNSIDSDHATVDKYGLQREPAD